MESFRKLSSYIEEKANHNQKLNKDVHVIIHYPQLDDGDFYEYLMTLTWQTGIPWNRGVDAKKHHVVFGETIDEALNKCEEYDYALISFVGTVFRRGQFAGDKTIWDYFDKWKDTDVPVKGHILWHPDREYGRLHPQTIFLDLNHWRKIGAPTFSAQECHVNIPERDPNNVHDDYTPWWIKPTNQVKVLSKPYEQAYFISSVLHSGKEIHNFTPAERSTKYFTYPQRKELSPPLVHDQNSTDDILYFRNNQLFSVIKKHMDKRVDKRPYDVIYSPASGNVGEFLWSEYGHEDTKLVFVDNHVPSIRFKEMCYLYNSRPVTVKELERRLKIVQNVFPNTHVDTCEYKPETYLANADVFSTNEWMNVMFNIKNVDVRKFDFIKSHLPISTHIHQRKLIYTSNIFSYWKQFHLYKLCELYEKFEYLTSLQNTTVLGNSPSRENILSEQE